MNNSDFVINETKSKIINAYKELLTFDDFNKISVKDVTKKAKISIRYFYVCYSSLEDVLEEIEQEYATEFYNKIKKINFKNNYEKIIKEYYSYIYENKLLEKIYIDQNLNHVRVKISKLILNYSKKDNKLIFLENYDECSQNIITSYINSSIVTTYREWIRSKKRIQFDEMVDLSTRLIKKGIKAL